MVTNLLVGRQRISKRLPDVPGHLLGRTRHQNIRTLVYHQPCYHGSLFGHKAQDTRRRVFLYEAREVWLGDFRSFGMSRARFQAVAGKARASSCSKQLTQERRMKVGLKKEAKRLIRSTPQPRQEPILESINPHAGQQQTKI